MATYLDEGMDIVSAMPGEVQRAMALIRDLDSGSTKLLDALKRKQTDYIKRVQDAVKDKPRTPGTDLRALSMDKEALAEIEAMREEVLQKSEEKVSVAEQARFVLAETLEGLDKHLLGFEQHLRSSGVFDPHGLPKDTPLADDGYGAGGSQAKRARVEVGRDAGGYGAAGGAGSGSAAIHASQYAGTSSSSQAAAAAPGHHGASAGTTAGAQSSMQGGGAGGGGYGNSSAVEQASRDAAARAAAAMARETSAAAAYAAAPAQVAAGAAGTAAAAAAPSEEQYCLCNGPSFGEMVGCDNDACTTGNGWFHLACVHLTAPPPEHVQWFCPTCKAAMDSKARRRK